MQHKKLFRTALAALFVALSPMPAQAQDTVARSYSFTPKDGMSAQFEVAIKAHMEWRAENGDPWTWGLSAVEVGDGLGSYGVRSSGHSFADLDSYDAGFGPRGLLHFTATVSPLIESVSSTLTTIDEDISNRQPSGTTLAFVTVTRFQVKPDRQAQFTEAITVASNALKESDWPGHWVWEMPISGGGMGPWVQVVGLHADWADMQEPDPPMLAVLAQAMGQNDFQDWLTSFGESIRGQEITTLRLRPDLNTN